MVTVIFRSRRTASHGDEYARESERMEGLVHSMPGFRSFRSYSAEDGERVSIGVFESLADLERWRDHPEHLAAQEHGRLWYYDEYSVQVCEQIRAYGFRRSERAGR